MRLRFLTSCELIEVIWLRSTPKMSVGTSPTVSILSPFKSKTSPLRGITTWLIPQLLAKRLCSRITRLSPCTVIRTFGLRISYIWRVSFLPPWPEQCTRYSSLLMTSTPWSRSFSCMRSIFFSLPGIILEEKMTASPGQRIISLFSRLTIRVRPLR